MKYDVNKFGGKNILMVNLVQETFTQLTYICLILIMSTHSARDLEYISEPKGCVSLEYTQYLSKLDGRLYMMCTLENENVGQCDSTCL